MMAAGGVCLWWLGSLVGPGAAGFYFLVYLEPKRWERLTAFWNEVGYQLQQSKIAIGSGGGAGLGLGKGVQKYGYVPEARTDFIFAIIGEELGLIGCGLVIVAFVILLVLAAKSVGGASSKLGRLMAFGLAILLSSSVPYSSSSCGFSVLSAAIEMRMGIARARIRARLKVPVRVCMVLK